MVEVDANGTEFTATVNGKTFKVGVKEGADAAAAKPAAAAAGNGEATTVAAPMPGTVNKILVKAGDSVSADDTVVILEAMKMETEIKAGKDGVVASVDAAQGAVVAAGDALVSIK